jgi:rubrerythrin
MTQGTKTSQVGADEYVEFLSTGDTVKGEFHCAECGYGVAIVRVLPLCPVCGGTVWEPSPWSPFTRAASVTPL